MDKKTADRKRRNHNLVGIATTIPIAFVGAALAVDPNAFPSYQASLKRRWGNLKDWSKHFYKGDKHMVYMHTFPDGMVYIGQTGRMTPEARWLEGAGYTGLVKKDNWRHGHFYRKGEFGQPRMARAVLKENWNDPRFKHEVLANGLTKEQADVLESELIEYYDSANIMKGYNRTKGELGKNWTFEAVEKWIKNTFFKHENMLYKAPKIDLTNWQGQAFYKSLIGDKATASEYWVGNEEKKAAIQKLKSDIAHIVNKADTIKNTVNGKLAMSKDFTKQDATSIFGVFDQKIADIRDLSQTQLDTINNPNAFIDEIRDLDRVILGKKRNLELLETSIKDKKFIDNLKKDVLDNGGFLKQNYANIIHNNYYSNIVNPQYAHQAAKVQVFDGKSIFSSIGQNNKTPGAKQATANYAKMMRKIFRDSKLKEPGIDINNTVLNNIVDNEWFLFSERKKDLNDPTFMSRNNIREKDELTGEYTEAFKEYTEQLDYFNNLTRGDVDFAVKRQYNQLVKRHYTQDLKYINNVFKNIGSMKEVDDFSIQMRELTDSYNFEILINAKSASGKTRTAPLTFMLPKGNKVQKEVGAASMIVNRELFMKNQYNHIQNILDYVMKRVRGDEDIDFARLGSYTEKMELGSLLTQAETGVVMDQFYAMYGGGSNLFYNQLNKSKDFKFVKETFQMVRKWKEIQKHPTKGGRMMIMDLEFNGELAQQMAEKLVTSGTSLQKAYMHDSVAKAGKNTISEFNFTYTDDKGQAISKTIYLDEKVYKSGKYDAQRATQKVRTPNGKTTLSGGIGVHEVITVKDEKEMILELLNTVNVENDMLFSKAAFLNQGNKVGDREQIRMLLRRNADEFTEAKVGLKTSEHFARALNIVSEGDKANAASRYWDIQSILSTINSINTMNGPVRSVPKSIEHVIGELELAINNIADRNPTLAREIETKMQQVFAGFNRRGSGKLTYHAAYVDNMVMQTAMTFITAIHDSIEKRVGKVTMANFTSQFNKSYGDQLRSAITYGSPGNKAENVSSILSYLVSWEQISNRALDKTYQSTLGSKLKFFTRDMEAKYGKPLITNSLTPNELLSNEYSVNVMEIMGRPNIKGLGDGMALKNTKNSILNKGKAIGAPKRKIFTASSVDTSLVKPGGIIKAIKGNKKDKYSRSRIGEEIIGARTAEYYNTSDNDLLIQEVTAIELDNKEQAFEVTYAKLYSITENPKATFNGVTTVMGGTFNGLNLDFAFLSETAKRSGNGFMETLLGRLIFLSEQDPNLAAKVKSAFQKHPTLSKYFEVEVVSLGKNKAGKVQNTIRINTIANIPFNDLENVKDLIHKELGETFQSLNLTNGTDITGQMVELGLEGKKATQYMPHDYFKVSGGNKKYGKIWAESFFQDMTNTKGATAEGWLRDQRQFYSGAFAADKAMIDKINKLTIDLPNKRAAAYAIKNKNARNNELEKIDKEIITVATEVGSNPNLPKLMTYMKDTVENRDFMAINKKYNFAALLATGDEGTKGMDRYKWGVADMTMLQAKGEGYNGLFKYFKEQYAQSIGYKQVYHLKKMAYESPDQKFFDGMLDLNAEYANNKEWQKLMAELKSAETTSVKNIVPVTNYFDGKYTTQTYEGGRTIRKLSDDALRAIEDIRNKIGNRGAFIDKNGKYMLLADDFKAMNTARDSNKHIISEELLTVMNLLTTNKTAADAMNDLSKRTNKELTRHMLEFGVKGTQAKLILGKEMGQGPYSFFSTVGAFEMIQDERVFGAKGRETLKETAEGMDVADIKDYVSFSTDRKVLGKGSAEHDMWKTIKSGLNKKGGYRKGDGLFEALEEFENSSLNKKKMKFVDFAQTMLNRDVNNFNPGEVKEAQQLYRAAVESGLLGYGAVMRKAPYGVTNTIQMQVTYMRKLEARFGGNKKAWQNEGFGDQYSGNVGIVSRLTQYMQKVDFDGDTALVAYMENLLNPIKTSQEHVMQALKTQVQELQEESIGDFKMMKLFEKSGKVVQMTYNKKSKLMVTQQLNTVQGLQDFFKNITKTKNVAATDWGQFFASRINGANAKNYAPQLYEYAHTLIHQLNAEKMFKEDSTFVLNKYILPIQEFALAANTANDDVKTLSDILGNMHQEHRVTELREIVDKGTLSSNAKDLLTKKLDIHTLNKHKQLSKYMEDEFGESAQKLANKYDAIDLLHSLAVRQKRDDDAAAQRFKTLTAKTGDISLFGWVSQQVRDGLFGKDAENLPYDAEWMAQEFRQTFKPIKDKLSYFLFGKNSKTSKFMDKIGSFSAKKKTLLGLGVVTALAALNNVTMGDRPGTHPDYELTDWSTDERRYESQMQSPIYDIPFDENKLRLLSYNTNNRISYQGAMNTVISKAQNKFVNAVLQKGRTLTFG
jgi:hypothetical protein